jgi:hypothetical protein
MTRAGRLQLRQDSRFGPIYVRRHPTRAESRSANIVPIADEGS